VITYDPADPRWADDPGLLFDEIRDHNPVHQTSDNYWVLTRHADCLALLRDRAASSDSLNIHEDKMPGAFTSQDRQLQRDLIIATGEDDRPFLFRDPPDHERLRGLVQRAFTPRRIAELEPMVRELSRGFVSKLVDAGPVDAVQQLAWPLPVVVICEMLGVPAADQDAFQDQSALLARGLDPEFTLSAEVREARDAAGLYFIDYFVRLFALRRDAPGDDLLSALVAARDGEDRLSEGELISTAILLLVAGHETTMNLISGALLLLSRDESAQAHVRAHGADRRAIDELLRLVTPVQFTGRSMTTDLAIGGAVLDEGSFVIALLGAANRDPSVFENPTTLDLTRDPNPQLGFGFGLHHCIGSALARLEAQVVLEEVMAATRHFAVTGPVRYRPNIVLRGLADLTMVFAT
jgi:cytochrome P450